MSDNITIWRALCMAACGYRVYVCAITERHAKSAFERCVNTLERIGLKRDVWTAHSSNGNRYIRFENGGKCRFTSREPLHIDGVLFEQVVFDELISDDAIVRMYEKLERRVRELERRDA